MYFSLDCFATILPLFLWNVFFFAEAAPPIPTILTSRAAYGPSLYSRGNYGGGGDVYGAIDKIPAPTSAYGAPSPPPPAPPYQQPTTYYGKPIPLPGWKDSSLSLIFGNGWGGYQPGFYRPVWEDDYNAVLQSIGSSYATLLSSRMIYVPRAPPPVYGDLGALSQHPLISETVVRDVLKGTALGDFQLISTEKPTAATTAAPAVNATSASVPAEKALVVAASDAAPSPAAPPAAAPVAVPAAPSSISISSPAATITLDSSSAAAIPSSAGIPGGAVPDCSFTSNNPTACGNPGTTVRSLPPQLPSSSSSSSQITVSSKEGGGVSMSFSDASAPQPPGSPAATGQQFPTASAASQNAQIMTQEDAAAAQPPTSSSKISSSFGALPSAAAGASPVASQSVQQPVSTSSEVISLGELEPLEQPPVHPARPGVILLPTSGNISKMSVKDAGVEPVSGGLNNNNNNLNTAAAAAAAPNVNNDVKLASSAQMNVIHIGSDSSLNMTELLHVLSSAKAAGQLNNVNEPTLTIVKQRGNVSSVLTVPTDELKSMMGPFGAEQSKLSADAVPQQPAQQNKAFSWANLPNVLTEDQANALIRAPVRHPLVAGSAGFGSNTEAAVVQETTAGTTTTAGAEITTVAETTSVATTSATEATTAVPNTTATAASAAAASTNFDTSSMINQINSNLPADGPKLVNIEIRPSGDREPPSSSPLGAFAANAGAAGNGAKTIVENRNVFVPSLPPLSPPSPSQQQQQQQQQQASGDVHFLSGTDAGNAALMRHGEGDNMILRHPFYPGAGVHYIDKPEQKNEGSVTKIEAASAAANNSGSLVARDQVQPKLDARLGLRPAGPTFFSQIDDPNAPVLRQQSNEVNVAEINDLPRQQDEQKPFIPSPQVEWPPHSTRYQTTTTTAAKPEKELSIQIVGPTAVPVTSNSPLRFGSPESTKEERLKINKWRKAFSVSKREQPRTASGGLLSLDDFLQPLVAIKADRPSK